MVLKAVPWPYIQWKLRWFRKAFYTIERPERDRYFVVDAERDEVIEALGRLSFAPNWELSYNYEGEDLNLSRVMYEESEEYDIRWWQVHVRGYVAEDGIKLEAHWEAEPSEHPEEHIDEVGFDIDRGIEELGHYLEQTDLTISNDPRA